MLMTDGRPTALWDGSAPGSEDWVHEEQTGSSAVSSAEIVRNVSVPTLTSFLPKTRSDRAVVVLPGGGMHFLSIENEGRSVAAHLRDAGISAFLLKYRVVPTPEDDDAFVQAISDAFRTGMDQASAAVIPLAAADAARAIELVRAEGYEHVTLLGFSAGARITAEIVLRGAPQQQPDAVGIIYLPSIEVSEHTVALPPMFLLAAADDPLGIDGFLSLSAVWRSSNAPADMHMFARGGHGFGIASTGLPVDAWPGLFVSWLRSLNNSRTVSDPFVPQRSYSRSERLGP